MSPIFALDARPHYGQLAPGGRAGRVEGGGGTPCNGLYGVSPPDRGTIVRLQVYQRVRNSQAEVYERVGKSVIQLFKIFRTDAPDVA